MNSEVRVSFEIGVFIFSWYMPRSRIAGSYGNLIFCFLQELCTGFHGASHHFNKWTWGIVWNRGVFLLYLNENTTFYKWHFLTTETFLSLTKWKVDFVSNKRKKERDWAPVEVNTYIPSPPFKIFVIVKYNTITENHMNSWLSLLLKWTVLESLYQGQPNQEVEFCHPGSPSWTPSHW